MDTLFGGLVGLMDAEAPIHPMRFYRAVPLEALLEPRPSQRLNAMRPAGGEFRLRFQGTPGLPFVVQASTNLVDWLPVATGPFAGELMEFIDADSLILPHRFSRVVPAP